jgi:glycosyltransferase involved in cell wall biosynthesis
VAEHRRRVRALAEQPGVRLLGPVPRPRVLELLAGSRVWAHPSWSTAAGMPFEEISCISAMEAQAAGLWAVASAVGALPETVRVGALVDARDAPGAAWRERLAAEIVRGLADPGTGARARREGPEAMRDLGWDGVAAAMDGLIGRRAAA